MTWWAQALVFSLHYTLPLRAPSWIAREESLWPGDSYSDAVTCVYKVLQDLVRLLHLNQNWRILKFLHYSACSRLRDSDRAQKPTETVYDHGLHPYKSPSHTANKPKWTHIQKATYRMSDEP